jgi:hypothetical protein
MHIDIRSWTSAFHAITMHSCVFNPTKSCVTIAVPLSSSSPSVPGPPLRMDLNLSMPYTHNAASPHNTEKNISERSNALTPQSTPFARSNCTTSKFCFRF